MGKNAGKRASGRALKWVLAFLLAAALALLAIFLLARSGRICITSASRPADRYGISGDLPGMKESDKAVLEGALAYVKTRPRYRSAYYKEGYPDDGYGVCTDVTAFAMKNAGLDLQKLVDADIAKRPGAYDITQPDPAIDFRRVKNLQVFFRENAKPLTLDISNISQWRGGDIVIFKNHIGIISDRRDRRGIPYVIHHSSPWQLRYEQDILPRRGDLTGHYRVSDLRK